MPGTTWVTGELHLAGDAVTGTKRRGQFVDRGLVREGSGFLDEQSGIRMALVLICVGIRLQIAEPEPGTRRPPENLVLLVPFELQWKQDSFCALDQLHQFGTLSADHQAYGVLTIDIRVIDLVAYRCVRLATAACPAKPDIIRRAGNELG